jgi:hypothetical protein
MTLRNSSKYSSRFFLWSDLLRVMSLSGSDTQSDRGNKKRGKGTG